MAEKLQSNGIFPSFSQEAPLSPSQLLRPRDPQDIVLIKLPSQERVFAPSLVFDSPGCWIRDDSFWVIGERRILVNISDVTAMVKEDDFLDQIARKNVHEVHLFPYGVNNNLSLNHNRPRNTITIDMMLSPNFTVQSVTLRPSFVISPGNFTYADALTILQNPNHVLHSQLTRAYALAQKLKHKKEENSERIPAKWLKSDLTFAEQEMSIMVALFMNLANQSIARIAYQENLPIIYLDHPVYRGESHSYSSHPRRFHDGTFHTHVTSPIRRYVDIYSWRVLKKFYFEEEEGRQYTYRDAEHMVNVINSARRYRQAS